MTLRTTPPPMWVIALTISSSVVGMTLLTPALPLIQNELSASSSAVQLLLTSYLATLAIGQLIYGTVSDLIGRRPILVFGAALYCVGGIVASLASTIEWLTFLRIIQGLGAAACLSMGRAIVNDCFERTDAAKNMSTIQMLQAIVPGLSLALGGIIAEFMGWQGAMVIMSILGLSVFIIAITMIKETHTDKASHINLGAIGAAYNTVLKNPVFVFFAVTSAMQVGMFFSMNAFLPYQYARLGFSTMEFGLWFSLTPLCYVIGNSLNRLYFISLGIERAAMIGCALTLVSVISLFTTQFLGMTHPLSLALPCCLFGFSNGMVIANATMGAISAAGVHGGTGTGIAGSWQMALSGIAGSGIISLGGDQNFQLATSILILMSLTALFSIHWIYRHR